MEHWAKFSMLDISHITRDAIEACLADQTILSSSELHQKLGLPVTCISRVICCRLLKPVIFGNPFEAAGSGRALFCLRDLRLLVSESTLYCIYKEDGFLRELSYQLICEPAVLAIYRIAFDVSLKSLNIKIQSLSSAIQRFLQDWKKSGCI